MKKYTKMLNVLFLILVPIPLASLLVFEEIRWFKAKPKIAMADMVIEASNSAPTNTAVLISVSRQKN